MQVSIVTTFYEGSQYIQNYIFSVVENAKSLTLGDSITAVLVNDSPWEAMNPDEIVDMARSVCQKRGYHDLYGKSLNVVVIQNPENLGIHESRVRGLQAAECDYVMFLDQDDIISNDAVYEFLRVARNTDEVLVCNACLEQRDETLIWYRNEYHIKQISNIDTYLDVGTQIISPGHTLVFADAIPKAWTTHICKKNGSDDYFLWLLLLEAGVEFRYIDESLYTHHYTASNLSADTEVTDESSFEFIDYMKYDGLISPEHIDRLSKMLRYKAAFRKAGVFGKAFLSLKNLKIFFINVRYKMMTKTPYGFNRE